MAHDPVVVMSQLRKQNKALRDQLNLSELKASIAEKKRMHMEDDIKRLKEMHAQEISRLKYSHAEEVALINTRSDQLLLEVMGATRRSFSLSPATCSAQAPHLIDGDTGSSSDLKSVVGKLLDADVEGFPEVGAALPDHERLDQHVPFDPLAKIISEPPAPLADLTQKPGLCQSQLQMLVHSRGVPLNAAQASGAIFNPSLVNSACQTAPAFVEWSDKESWCSDDDRLVEMEDREAKEQNADRFNDETFGPPSECTNLADQIAERNDAVKQQLKAQILISDHFEIGFDSLLSGIRHLETLLAGPCGANEELEELQCKFQRQFSLSGDGLVNDLHAINKRANWANHHNWMDEPASFASPLEATNVIGSASRTTPQTNCQDGTAVEREQEDMSASRITSETLADAIVAQLGQGPQELRRFAGDWGPQFNLVFHDGKAKNNGSFSKWLMTIPGVEISKVNGKVNAKSLVSYVCELVAATV